MLMGTQDLAKLTYMVSCELIDKPVNLPLPKRFLHLTVLIFNFKGFSYKTFLKFIDVLCVSSRFDCRRNCGYCARQSSIISYHWTDCVSCSSVQTKKSTQTDKKGITNSPLKNVGLKLHPSCSQNKNCRL